MWKGVRARTFMVVKVGLEMIVQGNGAGDVNGGLIDGMRMMSELELSRSAPLGLLILDLESNILHHHLVFAGRLEMLVGSILRKVEASIASISHTILFVYRLRVSCRR